jgi:hypothetical protein
MQQAMLNPMLLRHELLLLSTMLSSTEPERQSTAAPCKYATRQYKSAWRRQKIRQTLAKVGHFVMRNMPLKTESQIATPVEDRLKPCWRAASCYYSTTVNRFSGGYRHL